MRVPARNVFCLTSSLARRCMVYSQKEKKRGWSLRD
jgi:hypothetical protein